MGRPEGLPLLTITFSIAGKTPLCGERPAGAAPVGNNGAARIVSTR